MCETISLSRTMLSGFGAVKADLGHKKRVTKALRALRNGLQLQVVRILWLRQGFGSVDSEFESQWAKTFLFTSVQTVSWAHTASLPVALGRSSSGRHVAGRHGIHSMRCRVYEFWNCTSIILNTSMAWHIIRQGTILSSFLPTTGYHSNELYFM
jgi:hypothetical protein